MAVPAHDERDFAFAQKFGLPIRRVVAAPGTDGRRPDGRRLCRPRRGRAARQLRALRRAAGRRGRPAIVEKLAKSGKAEPKVTYRLRDWLISRQRYWGTPIPIIYCETDGIVPVPDDSLPVRLPENVDYHGRGDNPLEPRRGVPERRPARSAAGPPGARPTRWTRSWIRRGTGSATCRRTRRTARGPRDRRAWTPVDQYTGGAEHAVMHLLYSRFCTKAMRDFGLVDQTSRSSACSTRARSWAPTASGCQVPRQRPGPRRAGRSATAPTPFGCS